MKIAVIGAGFGGMAAAYDLVKAGHKVTIFESADYTGGLASGFKEPEWNSYVERFYHHWFQTDSAMLKLVKELGWQDKLVYPRPKTVVYHEGRFYPLDSPLAALVFPGYNFLDMVRFGFVTLFLRLTSNWKSLEKYTAYEWMSRWYGKSVYQTLFEPLLIGKFGPHYKDVTMAWFWARTKARTTRLGTFRGGFQVFSDSLAEHLRSLGVDIRLSTGVKKVSPLSGGGLALTLANGTEQFDQCLVTVGPAQLAKLAPDLPQDYLQGLLNMKSMGAVVMVLALKQKLSTQGYYWFNMPKSAGFPFLILVEHTNFIPPEQFGGDHILYIGDYLDIDHEYFKLTQEELLERFLPHLKRINPEFSPDWVRKSWKFHTAYAQPVPLVNHSKNIPDISTPVAGLYFASMSQVYPWDRGTNYAIELGRRAASLMLAANALR